MSAKKQEFSNDRPLVREADDKLNRAPFANRIAEILMGLPSGTGLIIGIHGPWGDGKTTVLNLICHNLDESSKAIAIEFNPWRFTDEVAMLKGFFDVLARTIEVRLSTKGEDVAKFIENLGRLASVVDDRLGRAITESRGWLAAE